MSNDKPPAHSTGSRGLARKILLRLAWLAVGFAIALVLGEVLVTLIHGPTVRFPRRVVEAPWGLRYNEPNARYGHHSPDVDVQFRINGQGMRADRDYAYQKPEGVRRIVCLGDSFTAGYEVQQEETFSSVLERTLAAHGQHVEVLNAGVSGFSTAEQLLYLERELWRFEPDIVVLSFFANDLADNLRTGLFGLQDGALVARAERYVPLGRLGNFLNTNAVFNFLSEHSNLMALLKEQVTLKIKSSMAEDVSAASSKEGEDPALYERRLAGALVQRMLDWCREHASLLIVQSIPEIVPGPALRDAFPYGEFSVEQQGLKFVRCEEFLAPWLGKELLYWTRSHFHWTPFAHRLSGERLAEVIEQAWATDSPAGSSH